MEKRPIDNEDEDDEDFGPSIPILTMNEPPKEEEPLVIKKEAPKKKARKEAKEEPVSFDPSLDRLPRTQKYERSYMHRDKVIKCLALSKSDFILTLSVDGRLKFWRRADSASDSGALVLIKEFLVVSSHPPQTSSDDDVSGVKVMLLSGSGDDRMCCTVAAKTVQVFDVLNIDMICSIQLDFSASAVCWIGSRLICISDRQKSAVYLYNAQTGELVSRADSIHSAPVTALAYNTSADCMISVDEKGMIEYWTPQEPFDLPSTGVKWQFKAETDLYELAKSKSGAIVLQLSPSGKSFLTFSLKDRCLRIFDFATGKLVRKFALDLATVREKRQKGLAPVEIDDSEFERRLIIESELDSSAYSNVIFDETGKFILYPSVYGIEVCDIRSGKIAAVIGSDEESLRFMNITLHQGMPAKKHLTLEMATSENPTLQKRMTADPALICTAYQSSRFYLFSKRMPSGDRDIMNEKIGGHSDKKNMKQESQTKTAQQVILRTSMGDIVIKLFPDRAPKAVENFATHCKNGYYDKIRFHRVIKGFMIQTGDPLEDGTGGDSIWGRPFEDECHPDLKHDKPFMVSMANSGPNSNGSQFFITTAPTPWLDGKHTIFGEVIDGTDTVTRIENVGVRKDRPIKRVEILSTEVK